MLIGRGTRRVVGIVVLVAVLAFVSLGPITRIVPEFWSAIGEARWAIIALIALMIVSNAYRMVTVRREPPVKKRPTHLRLVRDDES